jgi:hypothetical protein
MRSPFMVYFAGVGTVAAALGLGFSGGWVLSSSEPAKERPAIKQETAAKPELPKPEMPPLSSTPVTVRTPEENAAKPAEPAAEAKSADTQSAETKSTEIGPAETDGRAVPGANWVAMPPPHSTGTAATVAPVKPITAPLDPPAAQPAIAPQPAAPPAAVTIRRGPDAEERVTVGREPRAGEQSKPAEPSKPEQAKQKADRKQREADRRKTAKPRAVGADDEDGTAVERIVVTDEPERAPPAPPPMRDAGSLRGF